MPLFVCEKCKCIENTALCDYWSALVEGTPKLCSECDPEIGEWHGVFEKEVAELTLDTKGMFLNVPDSFYDSYDSP